jgi:sugar phosphate isomerase/epimerase
VWEPRWAPLEDGVVDFGLVFEALEHVGYDGWLVMEDFSGVRPSREALRYNLQFVRSFVKLGTRYQDMRQIAFLAEDTCSH